MIAVCVAVLCVDNFEGIQNASHEAIHLQFKIFHHTHHSADASWTNKSTDEEPTIKLVLTGDCMIHMNLLGLHEDGRELVVQKSAELKLEHQH